MVKNPLKLLNLASFLQAQLFLLPVLLLFYQKNGLTIGDFFLFQGVFSIASILFEIPSGYLADLFSKKKILILSFTFFLLRCLLWFFFAQYGYWIILIGEILFAAQKSFFSGISDAYIYEYLEANGQEKSMTKRYGFLCAFLSLGTALSSLTAAGLYSVISQWSMKHFGQDYGFMVLILLEIILTVLAIILLFQLPETATRKSRKKKSLKEIYSHFFRIMKWTFYKRILRYHIIFNAFLWGGTTLFVWLFQPMMQILVFPIVLYGCVYFVNHFCRTFFSFSAGKIVQYMSLNKIGIISYMWYVLGFIFTILILNINTISLKMSLLYFSFLCIGTGWQMLYGNVNLTRLHVLVPKYMRATVSSVNSMMGRLLSAIFLILLKFLTADFSLETCIGICFIFFGIGIFPLLKIYYLGRHR